MSKKALVPPPTSTKALVPPPAAPTAKQRFDRATGGTIGRLAAVPSELVSNPLAAFPNLATDIAEIWGGDTEAARKVLDPLSKLTGKLQEVSLLAQQQRPKANLERESQMRGALADVAYPSLPLTRDMEGKGFVEKGKQLVENIGENAANFVSRRAEQLAGYTETGDFRTAAEKALLAVPDFSMAAAETLTKRPESIVGAVIKGPGAYLGLDKAVKFYRKDIEDKINQLGGRDIVTGTASFAGELPAFIGTEGLVRAAIPVLNATGQAVINSTISKSLLNEGRKAATRKIVNTVVGDVAKEMGVQGVTGGAVEYLKTGDTKHSLYSVPAFALMGAPASYLHIRGMRNLPGYQVWKEAKSPAMQSLIDGARAALPDLTDEEVVAALHVAQVAARGVKKTTPEFFGEGGGFIKPDITPESMRLPEVAGYGQPTFIAGEIDIIPTTKQFRASTQIEGVWPQKIDKASTLYHTADDAITAATAFKENGAAVISAFKQDSIAGVVHEIGHILRRRLAPKQLANLEAAYGVVDGQWTKKAEEAFARDFENAAYTGKIYGRGQDVAFKQMRGYMEDFYKSVKDSPLNKSMSPEFEKAMGELRASRPAGSRVSTATWTAAESEMRLQEKQARRSNIIRESLDKPLETINNALDATVYSLFSKGIRLKKLFPGAKGQELYDRFIMNQSAQVGASKLAAERAKRTLEPVYNMKVNIDGQDMWAADFASQLATARHGLQLMDEGFNPSPEVMEHAPEILKQFENIKATNPEAAAAIEQATNNMVEWGNEILQRHIGGRVTQDAANAMMGKRPFYVPMNRVMEASDVAAVSGGTGGRMLRKLRGSDRPVNDALQNLIENDIASRVDVARNNLNRDIVYGLSGNPETISMIEVIQPGKDISLTREIAEEATDGKVSWDMVESNQNLVRSSVTRDPDVISVWDDGRQTFYRIKDPRLATALRQYPMQRLFANMSDPMVRGLVESMYVTARKAKEIYRSGVSLSAGFVARNPVRDIFSAFLNNPDIKTPADVANFIWGYGRAAWRLSGLSGADEFLDDMMRQGVHSSEFFSNRPQNIRQMLRDAAHNRGRFDIIWKNKTPGQKAGSIITEPIKAMESIGQFFERIPRYDAAYNKYQRLVAAGVPEEKALQDAALTWRRITADFGEMGSGAEMINKVSPFFSAQFAGMKAEIEALRRNPGLFLGKAFTAITIPSLVLWFKNKDEEWYKQLTPVQKNMYWWVNPYLRMPKPYGIAGMLMGSFWERIADSIYEKDPESFVRAFPTLVSMAGPSLPMPSPFRAAKGLLTNEDPFYGNIENPYERLGGKPAYLQEKPGTSETAKFLSKMQSYIPGVGIYGVSAPQIDYTITALGGGLPRQVLKLLEVGIMRAADKNKPEGTLADVPFVGAFRAAYPTTNTEPISRFYDDATKAITIQQNVDKLFEQGRKDEAERLFNNNKLDYLMADTYKAAMNGADVPMNMSNLNGAIKILRNSQTEGTPREKRLAIESAANAMNDLASGILKYRKQVERNLNQ